MSSYSDLVREVKHRIQEDVPVVFDKAKVMSEIQRELDVEKRACAKMNGLKYLVFWDTKLQDAQLWFDCGCPDATDWEREYSWLLKRTLSEHL